MTFFNESPHQQGLDSADYFLSRDVSTPRISDVLNMGLHTIKINQSQDSWMVWYEYKKF